MKSMPSFPALRWQLSFWLFCIAVSACAVVTNEPAAETKGANNPQGRVGPVPEFDPSVEIIAASVVLFQPSADGKPVDAAGLVKSITGAKKKMYLGVPRSYMGGSADISTADLSDDQLTTVIELMYPFTGWGNLTWAAIRS